MAKPDGRIEKGQRLSTAISARAWNRAQDAADIVLGVRPGVEAGPLSSMYLPSVRVTLREKGYFGQVKVFNELVSHTIGGPSIDVAPGDLITPTGPAGMTTLSESTEEEKGLLNFTLPRLAPLSSQGLQGSLNSDQAANGASVQDASKRFAVCVGNDSNEYAISGLAITRVRVFHYAHRYARLASDTGFVRETPLSEINGMLDSCFWGNALILGYACSLPHSSTSAGSELLFRHVNISSNPAGQPVWPNWQVRWALVHF